MKRKPRRRICQWLHDGTTFQDKKNEAIPPSSLCLNLDRAGMIVEPDVDCINCLSKSKSSFLFGKLSPEFV